MNEKLFKRVKGSGAAAITTGIITVVAGAACGILMIVTGSCLRPSRIHFFRIDIL